MRGRISHPIHVNTTITEATYRKLQRRAALQSLSIAQVLRVLVDQLPALGAQPAPKGEISVGNSAGSSKSLLSRGRSAL